MARTNTRTPTLAQLEAALLERGLKWWISTVRHAQANGGAVVLSLGQFPDDPKTLMQAIVYAAWSGVEVTVAPYPGPRWSDAAPQSAGGRDV